MFSNNVRMPIRQVIRYFFKLSFHLLYHEFSWTYDWVADFVSMGRWQVWVLSVVPYLSNSLVLELGSGPGHLQLALAEQGKHPFGIDASWQMARMANKRLQHNSVQSNICFGRAQALPYASAKFDKIVATFPSEYIIDSKTLENVRRVLKENGELIIMPFAWITGTKWSDRLAAGLFRLTGQAPNSEVDYGDFGDFNPEDFLEKHGFETRKEIIQLPSSKVLIIRANKIFPGKNRRELE